MYRLVSGCAGLGGRSDTRIRDNETRSDKRRECRAKLILWLGRADVETDVQSDFRHGRVLRGS